MDGRFPGSFDPPGCRGARTVSALTVALGEIENHSNKPTVNKVQ